MKQYLALFLIAIMAVSVLSAAGVATAQKAAAQPVMPMASSMASPAVKPIGVTYAPTGVTYRPGATYRYTPRQFNNAGTQLDAMSGTPMLSGFAFDSTCVRVDTRDAHASRSERGVGGNVLDSQQLESQTRKQAVHGHRDGYVFDHRKWPECGGRSGLGSVESES